MLRRRHKNQIQFITIISKLNNYQGLYTIFYFGFVLVADFLLQYLMESCKLYKQI